jgi:hypothetical protein
LEDADGRIIRLRRLAGGRRTIESLPVKEQADPHFMEALEYAEQVGQRSTEPIH